MKTIEIEVALMKALDIRTNIIVPNVSWGIAGLHECDLLVLSKSNYATEIEIKISKYDLKNESKKFHNHTHNHINKFYFAVPEELKEFALEYIPDRAGLFTIKKFIDSSLKERVHVNTIRLAKKNKSSHQWTDVERNKLTRLGTMRIYKLKEKLSKYMK